jgi:hypothetical protein
MAVERTLSIIKPDAVAKNVIGKIYSRFESNGLKIIASRMAHLSRAEAEGFYAVHKGRPFFNDLVAFMTSGPVMIQVLEGEGADCQEPRTDGRHRSRRRPKPAPSAPISPKASTPTPCTVPTRRKPPPWKSPTSSPRPRCSPANGHGGRHSRIMIVSRHARFPLPQPLPLGGRGASSAARATFIR